MIAPLIWVLALPKIDAGKALPCAGCDPPLFQFTVANQHDAAVTEDEAGHLADQYVKDQGLNWGQHTSVQKISSGYAIEYATPERENRDIGPRQLIVSWDGTSISRRKGRR